MLPAARSRQYLTQRLLSHGAVDRAALGASHATVRRRLRIIFRPAGLADEGDKAHAAEIVDDGVLVARAPADQEEGLANAGADGHQQAGVGTGGELGEEGSGHAGTGGRDDD